MGFINDVVKRIADHLANEVHSLNETPTGAQLKVDIHKTANVSASVHPNALIQSFQNYSGNNTQNRALAHGLGSKPSFFFMVTSGGTQGFAWINGYGASQYGYGNDSAIAVAEPDATNIYVGNAGFVGNAAGANYTVWIVR